MHEYFVCTFFIYLFIYLFISPSINVYPVLRFTFQESQTRDILTNPGHSWLVISALHKAQTSVPEARFKPMTLHSERIETDQDWSR